MTRIRRSARVAEWVGKRAALLVLALSLALAAGVAQAASAPVDTVSPGGIDRMTLVRGTAPTFSWGSVAGAESYEVLVYELSDSGRESEAPSLSVSLPGSASSWTPDARRGLEAGRDYVWFVRAVTDGKAAALSRGRMFTISGAPSLAEVEAAMDVLRRYSEADESTIGPSAVGVEAQAGVGGLGTAPSPSTQPAAAPDVADEAVAGPSPPAPLAPIPLRELGISSSTATTNTGPTGGGDAIAVRGEYDSTDHADRVVGYLGVAVSDTDAGEFDGFEVLNSLDQDEMGVLGVSTNDSSDNYGVVGVATGSARAGRFFNASATGVVTNEVFLGTSTLALDAIGPIRWDCPSDMDRVGTWCIDKVANASTNGGNSITVCHNEGKTLCPLQALMTCDQLNIRNGVTDSCGDRTDTAGTLTRTFGIDNDPTSGASAFDEFVTYLATGNALAADLNATNRSYFCCRPVSP